MEIFRFNIGILQKWGKILGIPDQAYKELLDERTSFIAILQQPRTDGVRYLIRPSSMFLRSFLLYHEIDKETYDVLTIRIIENDSVVHLEHGCHGYEQWKDCLANLNIRHKK